LLLFAGGASVDVQTEAGKTALAGAVMRGNVDIAGILLEEGANPNLSNCAGVSPLMIAARRGYVALARLLLDEYNAYPNLVDNRGRTALHYAARSGAEDIVRLMLDDAHRRSSIQTEVDVDIPMSDGRTALHLAAQQGHASIVEILIKKGAKINLEDANGDTALDCAKASVNVNAFRLLRAAQEPRENVPGDNASTRVHGVACSQFTIDLFSDHDNCRCGFSEAEHSAAAFVRRGRRRR
jgi:ankyrin repeat protein